MKIRNGFVSNSSSSSFILDGNKYSVEIIGEYISKLLEAENLIQHSDKKVDDICTIKKYNYVEDYYKDSYIEDYEEYGYKRVVCDCPVIVVDSVRDNSIPWAVQSPLEDIALKRHHWG